MLSQQELAEVLYECAICGALIGAEQSSDGSVYLASRYWHGTKKEAYCSPEHSLLGHKENE